MKYIVTKSNNGYFDDKDGILLYNSKDNKGADVGMILNGTVKDKKYYKYNNGKGETLSGKFLAVLGKPAEGANQPAYYVYLPINTVKAVVIPAKTTHSGKEYGAEGSTPAPTTPSASPLATAKGYFDNAKNIAMDTTVLSGAGIGIGTGLAISWLMGVRGSSMAGITATTTVLGGWAGYGFSQGGGYHGADGLPNTRPQSDTARLYADGARKAQGQYTDCVKHIFQDSYRKVMYEFHIWAIDCKSPSVPKAIKFVDDFMNIHIKQGIVNTPSQIVEEISARFKNEFPSLKLSMTNTTTGARTKVNNIGGTNTFRGTKTGDTGGTQGRWTCYGEGGYVYHSSRGCKSSESGTWHN